MAFKHTVLTAHPVEAIQRAHFKNESDAALHIAERVYGAHSAWQMKLDRALVRHRARAARAARPLRNLNRPQSRPLLLSLPTQLSRMQPRAPGAEPRGFGPLETYLRRDDKLDMEDVLGLPELKPRVERLSVHQAAERALSLDR